MPCARRIGGEGFAGLRGIFPVAWPGAAAVAAFARGACGVVSDNTLDPGSRAKRYFAGFGAGKSSVKVAGVVTDAQGKTLATFEQRRIGSMGMGGGDSLGKLMADSRNIGEDIATFLARWARGDSLKD